MPKYDDTSTSELRSKKIIYVEGESELSLDVNVITELLSPSTDIEVHFVGGCDNVLAAMQAFAKIDNQKEKGDLKQYFIIDRVDRADNEVNECWENGIFTKENNKLIWRRNELENYFIEPNFLIQSKYWNPKKIEEDLIKDLIKEAQKRIYFDAANLVIKKLIRYLEYTEISKFKFNEINFSSEESAENILISNPIYNGEQEDHNKLFTANWLREQYHSFLEIFFGSNTSRKIEMGQGKWLERMFGKELMNSIINHRYFIVKGTTGKNITGENLRKRVTRALVKNIIDIKKPPQDLLLLRDYFIST